MYQPMMSPVQMPQARVRTRISPSPTAGTSISAMPTSRFSSRRATRMVRGIIVGEEREVLGVLRNERVFDALPLLQQRQHLVELGEAVGAADERAAVDAS